MNKIHPNRILLEEYRKKCHKYAKEGFLGSLTRVRTWSPIIHFVLNATGFAQQGLANAKKLSINNITLNLDNLPIGFNGCKILFIADLHIEGIEDLADRIIELIGNLEYDYCFLGGDYSLYDKYDFEITRQRLRKIAEYLKIDKTFGILGNHDYYEVAVFLQNLGVKMLINENVLLKRNDSSVYLVGVDDCYLFNSAELSLAAKGIPPNSFKILLTHCPQLYKQAQDLGFNLLLAGHTHGGQICLPGQVPVIKCAKIPRRFIKGVWQYKNLTGFTTVGAGSSGNVIARFNCPPEIALITLKSANINI